MRLFGWVDARAVRYGPISSWWKALQCYIILVPLYERVRNLFLIEIVGWWISARALASFKLGDLSVPRTE